MHAPIWSSFAYLAIQQFGHEKQITGAIISKVTDS